jgi:hypothetical protein
MIFEKNTKSMFLEEHIIQLRCLRALQCVIISRSIGIESEFIPGKPGLEDM